MKHLLAILVLCCTSLPAFAGEAWESVREQLFGDRTLLDGSSVIAIDAPYRTPEDARASLAAQVVAPAGARVARVYVVLDENPMPVSAVFDLANPQPGFFFDVTMRINGPTPMHVVAETSDGRLYVAETFVKTSGQGACSAPPGSDRVTALATLGQMTIDVAQAPPGIGPGKLTSLASQMARMDLLISHPSHSGMQMDQISLLFVPMRYIDKVAIDLDGARFVEMSGSIALSENPRVSLAVPHNTKSVEVTMTDTDGTVATARKDLSF